MKSLLFVFLDILEVIEFTVLNCDCLIKTVDICLGQTYSIISEKVFSKRMAMTCRDCREVNPILAIP